MNNEPTPTTDLTKLQAKKALEEGKKLRHTSFTDDEWMRQENGVYILEDGVRCPIPEFWRWRTDPNFETGWTVINEPKAESTPTTLSAELQRELEREIEHFLRKRREGQIGFYETKEFILSPIVKRIHREGWMPVQWNSPDNPPIQRNKKHNSSGDILLLGKGGWIGIGCYYFGLKKFDSDHIIGWMYLPSPNAPVGKGYISVEEADKMVLEAVRELTIKKCDEAIELINKNYTPPNAISIEEHERQMKEFSEFTGRYLVNPNLRYRNTDELLAQFKSTKEEGGSK